MPILFLHGRGSEPGGEKPAHLRRHGHEVINPALPDDDFEQSVRIAQEEFDRRRPDAVVGSSRGGAVAMNLDAGQVPLVLIAPAWKRWGKAVGVKPGTVILHSEHDEVVPVQDSRELVARSGLKIGRLLVVGDNHRMIDRAALDALLKAVQGVR